MNKENIKLYKLVLQLDYKINFKILNLLGDVANRFAEFIENNKLDNYNVSISNSNRLIFFGLKNSEDEIEEFKLDFTPKRIILEIYFDNGILFENISKIYSIKIINELFTILKENNIEMNKFNRFGYKVIAIKEDQKNSYENIIKAYKDKFHNLINNKFDLDDIGIVFDMHYDKDYKFKIQFGPFQNQEFSQHFIKKIPAIEKGYIYNLDLFNENYSLDIYDFKKIIKFRIDIISEIINEVWKPL
jgi:hypothetical protein